jgi:hypothetical protein
LQGRGAVCKMLGHTCVLYWRRSKPCCAASWSSAASGLASRVLGSNRLQVASSSPSHPDPSPGLADREQSSQQVCQPVDRTSAAVASANTPTAPTCPVLPVLITLLQGVELLRVAVAVRHPDCCRHAAATAGVGGCRLVLLVLLTSVGVRQMCVSTH